MAAKRMKQATLSRFFGSSSRTERGAAAEAEDDDASPASAAAPPAAVHHSLFNVRETDGEPIFAPRSDTFADEPPFRFVQLPFYVTQTFDERPKWPLIREALSKPIGSPAELLATFRQYSECRFTLRALEAYCFELDEEAVASLFSQTIPFIARLALDLPNAIHCYVPLLDARREASVSLTQYQAACILANAFFNTFDLNQPDYQACLTFYEWMWSDCETSIAKLNCIFHYFRRVQASMPNGVLTFHRRVLTPDLAVDWARCTKPLQAVRVAAHSLIEDEYADALQVDFANEYIGGGVLGHGCVQEEIMFVVRPELLVSILLCQRMEKSEAIIMTGAQRFSSYTGYGRSFAWQGNYSLVPPRDKHHRVASTITAIDALNFSRSTDARQWSESAILRELNKALIGFLSPDGDPAPCPVATGKWGCGVFNGDARLKALIQLMAVSAANRRMHFLTFHDEALADQLSEFLPVLAGKTVAELFNAIMHALPAGHDGSRLLAKVFQTFQPSSEPVTQELPDPDDTQMLD